MLVFIYNKCYILPEAGTLQEVFAPSPYKIPRKLRTLLPSRSWQYPVKVTNLKRTYELLRLRSFRRLAHQTTEASQKRKNSMETEDGLGVIMEADKGNCFVVID